MKDLLAEYDARPSRLLQLAGTRASAAAYALRDFLSRNQVPFEWIELDETRTDGVPVEFRQVDNAMLPICLLPDGSRLDAPTIAQLAAALGLLREPSLDEYDLAIVGAGPAGLAAAVYAASDGLRTIAFEAVAPGGQAGTSSMIENYLGFPDGISGGELALRAREQARRFGAELLIARSVTRVLQAGGVFHNELSDGTVVRSLATLAAGGVEWRRLDVPGVAELLGSGVYYGASPAEGARCRGEEIAIVGGGNSAGQAAIYFARHANRVTVLVRDASLDTHMSRYLVDRIAETDNIEVKAGLEIVEVVGDDWVRAARLRDRATAEVNEFPLDALFVCIGGLPRSDWVAELGVACDRGGFILTGIDIGPDVIADLDRPLAREPFPLETTVPGLFAAGDVRYGSIKRVSAAIGEGAGAVAMVHRWLNYRLEHPNTNPMEGAVRPLS
jgi:thioredoxin reductase (NADPH)